MKYMILCDSDNVEPFTQPRQLNIINGETIVGRIIRLLKENGVKDVYITSHDERFDGLGAVRYEPKYNDYKPRENKGYWVSAFPVELLNEPITFLFGDCYYSEQAIKTIIEADTDSVLYFCSYKNKDTRYAKHHDEPFAFKVVDYELFAAHIKKVKQLKDEGKTAREPIAWELYRSMNGIDINRHILTENYIVINDETCDIDRVEDTMLITIKTGGYKTMAKVKVKCIMEYEDLHSFPTRKIIKVGDEPFWVDGKRAEQLVNAKVCEVIEVIPDEPKEEPKTEVKKTTRKKKK